jgi:hypothetical protein
MPVTATIIPRPGDGFTIADGRKVDFPCIKQAFGFQSGIQSGKVIAHYIPRAIITPMTAKTKTVATTYIKSVIAFPDQKVEY